MKISILGGGIGGLSTAIALKLADFDVEVYERHATTSDIGAGIVCWPNACFVLEQLGVLDKIAQVSGSLNKMNRYSSDGNMLGSLNIKQLDKLMGYPSYSIIRHDLMQILTQRAVELSININYHYNVSSLSDNGNGQTIVEFDNGKTIQPDIIIGIDGRMNSIARRYVNGDNKPIYQGFINWIAAFDSPNAIFSDISVSDYWGVGERFGIIPVSSKKAYWAAAVSSESIGSKNPEEYKQELNAIFSSWPDPISNLINNTTTSQINKVYVHDHDPIKTWHKNNVLLLGDAAHSALPTSGQGACQALEDAWHITNCLKQNGDDLQQAFSQLTQLRFDKTSWITIGGRQQASSIFNRDPEFCLQRDLASKNTDYNSMLTAMAKGWASGLPIG